uniref:Uncharacterized protein n=1 Tax=viral metagenome TaxID=1070528 RepID=A0A6C0BVA9_9ZZZZ
MCDSEMDYSLVIEFEKLTVEELKYTLQILYHSSSECFVDIENLADEVIIRLVKCRYNIREKQNKNLKQLIVSTFETLKSISHFMEFPSERIQIIYDNYHKYMHGIESPVASPVLSPKIEEDKLPKIMNKVQKVKVPKIMKKAK